MSDFVIDEKGCLTKYNGSGGDVVIPDGVTGIGPKAFSGCKKLKSITIPESVIQIGWSAFENCTNLKSVYYTQNLEAWLGIRFAGWDSNPCQPRGAELYIGGALATDMEIPNGVTGIDDYAFCGCSSLTSVKIPESVTSIGFGAFMYCSNLASITIPEGVISIGGLAFEDCSSLKGIIIPNSVKEIGDSAFSCCEKLSAIKLPSNLQEIKSSCFSGCSNLEEIEIPPTVTKIGDMSFIGCDKLESIVIPESVEYVGYSFVGNTALKEISLYPGKIKFEIPKFSKQINIVERLNILPDGMKNTGKLPTSLTVFCIQDPEQIAWIGLHQGDKKWREWFCGRMDEGGSELINDVALKMADILKSNGKIPQLVHDRVADFVAKYKGKIKPENVQAIQECFGDANHAVVKKKLSTAEVIKKNKTRMTTWLERRGITTDSFAGMKADPATVEAIMFVLYEYGRQMAKEPSYHASSWKTDIVPVTISPEADEIAKTIDRQLLMDAINLKPPVFHRKPLDANDPEDFYDGHYYAYNRYEFLMPLCRFADAATIKTLKRNADFLMRKFSMEGRRAAIAIRSGLLLSDTKEAAAYLDKYNQLDLYAEMRHKTATEIRSANASDPALDENGVIDFGLSVEGRLTDDLKIVLFDPDKEKEVKSFPKKNNDPEKLKEAEAKFKELKQTVKTVVSSQKTLLKKMFLSGETVKADQWKKDYLGNPILSRIAGLLVWQQGTKLFTVRAGKAILADEKDYALSKEPVFLAHPIEMPDKQIREWQEYFLDNDLKQFFAQVWEPLSFRKPEDIHPDRYKDCQITVGHILSLENQGLVSYNYHYEFLTKFVFAGGISIPGELESQGYYFTAHGTDNAVTLGEMGIPRSVSPKKLRELNRAFSCLDRWIVSDKIAADDDEFLRKMLAGQTLAQVREYLNLAIESGAEKCKALLLDFRDKNYPDYDYVEEFSLD